MEDLNLTHIPVAKAGMLIRKPVATVYEALVDPAITTRFWFTHSSGRLEAGKKVRWEWEMYAASVEVSVKALEPHKRIFLEWGANEAKTNLEFTFTPRPSDTTFVSITDSGFSGNGDKVTELAMDSASGFALVLAGLKAYLEHGIELNLIADRFPDQLVNLPTPPSHTA